MVPKNSQGWASFVRACSKIESPEALKEFLTLFLTLEEQETLGQRFLIVKALKEEKLTQREIAHHFHVSISQITRGSNALKVIPPSLDKILKSL